MRVIIEADAAAAAATAANFIADLVRQKADAVLGLATGGTPVSCYQTLIEMHRREGLDFSQVRTFNLDEYVGLSPSHPQSYHYFMQEQLFDHLNLQPERCHIPDGVADDLARACAAYEAAIREAGGIDLQLLGIGTDGHIAFNEPGSSLAGRTRVKHLTSETIRDNARFFGNEASVPRLAVTMGVGTILEAGRCLLLATGANKSAAVHAAVEGPVTASVTASALQLHPDVVMVLDEAAAGQLERREYYKMAEAVERTRCAATE